MKLNVRRFFSLLALFLGVLWMSGCTAAWLGAVSALLPALEAAVSAAVAFVLALEGKTVPPSVAAAIKKIGSDVAAEIANVQQLIAQFKASASTGLLSQIQAVLNAVVQNLANILSAANVTDGSTVAKITQLVGLAVAAAQAILALIPVAIAKMNSGASHAELQAEDKVATQAIEVSTKNLKDAYTVIVTSHTDNPDVNAALDSLPRTI